jgi:hypothetical protein
MVLARGGAKLSSRCTCTWTGDMASFISHFVLLEDPLSGPSVSSCTIVLFCISFTKYIVTYRYIVRQRLYKHVPAETDSW